MPKNKIPYRKIKKEGKKAMEKTNVKINPVTTNQTTNNRKEGVFMNNNIYSLTDGIITSNNVSLNDTIKSVHEIKSYSTNDKKRAVAKNDNYNVAFENIGDYISQTSIILARTIIFSMYCNMYKVIDKDNSTKDNVVYKWVHGVNYESAKSIVNNGYNDCMFDDIVQEIALYMFNNHDRITQNHICIDWNIYNNNSCFDTCYTLKYSYSFENDMFLEIYKVVRKYLYNNQQKQINKEYSIMELETGDDNNPYYEINARVNSKDYLKYTYNEIEKTHSDLSEIIDNITMYAWYNIPTKEQSKYKFETLKKVILSLAKGETFKQSGLSNNSYWKYKKALIQYFSKNDFIKLYNNAVQEVEHENYLHSDNTYNHYDTMYFDNDYTCYNFGYFNIVNKYGINCETPCYIPTNNNVQFNDNKYCRNAIIDKSFNEIMSQRENSIYYDKSKAREHCHLILCDLITKLINSNDTSNSKDINNIVEYVTKELNVK